MDLPKEVIDINRICRFCADINTKLYPIFENKLDEKVKSFSEIQVVIDDGLPDMICALCKYKLNTAYDFKIQILSIDRKLRDLLNNDDLNESDVDEIDIQPNKDTETTKSDTKDIKSDTRSIKSDTRSIKSDTGIKNDPIKVEIGEINKIVHELETEQNVSSQNDLKLKRRNQKLNDSVSVSCPECGRLIKKHCLKDHIKTHTRIADRECPICGMMLLTRAALWQHKKVVHGQKQPINCDQCGKNFATNSCFKVHYRNVHLKIKKYQCEVCKRSFGLPKTLKHHMQTHTGDRPYICQHCGKGVSSPFALRQHIRLHTNEAPYNCSECGEGFKQKVTMKLHYRRVHLGITPEQEKMAKMDDA